jgi:hypothetical protein
MTKFNQGERSSYQERVSSKVVGFAFPMHRASEKLPVNPCSMDETVGAEEAHSTKMKAEEAMQLAPPLVLGIKR